MTKSIHDQSNLPFWVETPQQQYRIPQERSFAIKLIYFSIIVGFLALLLELVFAIYSFAPSPFNLICGGYLILTILASSVPSYFMNRKRKAEHIKAATIQENAKKQARASIMGDAIHVAGHPSLGRDQPIVLAMTNDNLDFYSFASSTALVSLGIDDIHVVKTVVYDDERVPHAEVVDSAAQALQIEFNWKGQVCTVLLRAMKQVRPIDWYHAIQKERLS